MSKQHHFVVVYDDEADEFEIDDGTADARFSDGVIYDTNTEEWSDIIGRQTATTDVKARIRLEKIILAANLKGPKP